MSSKHRSKSASDREHLNVALATLSDLAAAKDNRVFEPEQGSEQVLALLQWAVASRDREVNAAFVQVGEYLGSGHKRFFENNGIVFAALLDIDPPGESEASSKTYRGQSIVADKTGQQDNKGKRRVIYRGQEKWV